MYFVDPYTYVIWFILRFALEDFFLSLKCTISKIVQQAVTLSNVVADCELTNN